MARCSGSPGSSRAESVYEVGEEGGSLSSSLHHLDTPSLHQESRPSLLQVSTGRTQPLPQLAEPRARYKSTLSNL